MHAAEQFVLVVTMHHHNMPRTPWPMHEACVVHQSRAQFNYFREQRPAIDRRFAELEKQTREGTGKCEGFLQGLREPDARPQFERKPPHFP